MAEQMSDNRRNAAAASRGRKGVKGWLENYLQRHLQTFFYALGQLSRHPFATLMTTAVIGIALALPTGMHVVLKNLQEVLAGWDTAAQVSLFLKEDVSEEGALTLADTLRARPEIMEVSYISREQALEEFRRHSGFGEALDALEENPLPAVLVVQPALDGGGPEQVQALLSELKAISSVDLAKLDMEWVERLYGWMEMGRRGVWVLSSLLALAVLLVVGNTIRLAIQNRRDEIVITKLIGGTDAFIRRPFLYSGFWYGLFGGVIAWLLVTASLLALEKPVSDLSSLYLSAFRLTGLDLVAVLGVLGGGMLLGLVGSWLAVGRHLRDIEPS